MRRSAHTMLAGSLLAGLCMAGAAGGAKAVEAEPLMVGDGTGTSFASKGWNRKGTAFDYQACHRPDGRIVARADYGAGNVYHASGHWKTEEGKICVDWSTEGWIDGCFAVALTESGFEMTNVADGKKTLAAGAFDNGYYDWCSGRF